MCTASKGVLLKPTNNTALHGVSDPHPECGEDETSETSGAAVRGYGGAQTCVLSQRAQHCAVGVPGGGQWGCRIITKPKP